MKQKIKTKTKKSKPTYFSKLTYEIKRSAIFKYDLSWV